MSFSKFIPVLLFFLLNLQFKSVSAAKEAGVQITPTGDLESVEQVQAYFSDDMVELGKGQEALPPVESDCFSFETGKENGHGYWTDEKTWVFTFKRAPAPNTICKVSTVKDLKTFKKTAVTPVTVSFKTLTAQVLDVQPSRYNTIDANQYFVITLNGKPDAAWIKKNVYFKVDGLGDRITPEIVSESEKSKVLQQLKESNLSSYSSRYGEYDEGEDSAKSSADEMKTVIKASRNFPRGSDIQLHWLHDFDFSVNKAFKAEFNCERESAQSACVPLSSMTVRFTDDISAADLKKIYLQNKKAEKIYPAELKKTSSKASLNYVTFSGPFDSAATYTLFIQGLRSLDNESLSNENSFPLKVTTAEPPSLLKIDRTFSVIEASNPVLPVTLRNVETPLPGVKQTEAFPLKSSSVVLSGKNVADIISLLKEVNQADYATPMQKISHFKPVLFNLGKKLANDNLEIVGLTLKGKGLHFTEFKSRILGQKINYEPGKNADYYVRSLALVTDINLTMKFSENEVLVWATSLSTAESLKQINVGLYDMNGNKIKETRTDEKGVAYFKLSQAETEKLKARSVNSYQAYSYGFMAFAQLGDDYSFIWSDDTRGLEKYRFGLNVPNEDPEIIYHAVLERNLLRPNEKLRAKLIYRKLENIGLSIPQIELPKKIQLKSAIDKKKISVNVKWDKTTGTGTLEWSIPEQATLGSYSISASLKETDDEEDEERDEYDDYYAGSRSRNPRMEFGHFSVEEFKIPNISTQLMALNAPWINVKSQELEFSARYLSGGPAAQMPIKVRYSTQSTEYSVENEDYADFRWQAGVVAEGITKYGSEQTQNSQPQINQLDLKLDSSGVAKFSLKGLKYQNNPQSAVVSVEYKDANGEIKTQTRAYPLLISEYFVGIKSKSWYQTAESFEYVAALLDHKEKPVAGKSVTLSLYKVDNYSTRKKILGGFYSYESFEEIKKVKDLCTEKTDNSGVISCKGSDKSLGGEYIVAAHFTDPKGVKVSTKMSSYLSGSDYWFGGSDSDRMDLIPFKKSYEPGETAEFQIRGPISEGQMLVTVERKGVLSHFVQNFNKTNPTVRIKISEEWAPNIVVSAVLIRGRIEGAVSGTLDLGKPALKMGMASINVGIKKHILDVKVSTEKEVYQPRDNVNAVILVTDSDGKPVNGELAVAAVDEGLLALSPNRSWDLISKFLAPRAHSVNTAYIISQVLGKRTLGLKAVPAGGDGGGAGARELFDSSLFWSAKVPVKNGRASVNFKANDSLTSFKIVAIALSGAQQFGTGSHSIQVTKDFQTYPSLALAVRNGDNYLAQFSVRNRTNENVKLKALLSLNGKPVGEKEFSLNSNQSSELNWPVQADTLTTEQNFELKVLRGDKIVDLLKIKQPVQYVWAMRTMGSSFRQSADMSVPIATPDKATDSLLKITAIPSLASDLPGLQTYWDLYPFDCFEQRLSKAISLNSKTQFAELMKISDLYIDSDGLIKFYPRQKNGSVFLTNYVLQITKLKKWNLPKEFEEKALDALENYFDGKLEADDYYNRSYKDLVRLETLDSLSLYGHSAKDQLSTIDIKPEILPNNYLAHYISVLTADSGIEKRDDLLTQALQILRSRTVASSNRLSLKDAVSERMWGLYTNDDITFSKILVNIFDKAEFKDDAGKLILSYLEFAKNGYWYNTMANAWANVTLEHYKNRFEKSPVIGEIKWGLAGDLKSAKINNDKQSTQTAFKGSQTARSEFKGSGVPWMSFLVLANPPLSQDSMHGIEIEKNWRPVQVKDTAKKHIGDIWEITVNVKTKSEFQWMALRDPIPPGAMILEESDAFNTEKKALEYRIYENWFYSGDKSYTYQIRLNQAGTFHLPATRAEAMYDTDLYGEKLNGDLVVLE